MCQDSIFLTNQKMRQIDYFLEKWYISDKAKEKKSAMEDCPKKEGTCDSLWSTGCPAAP